MSIFSVRMMRWTQFLDYAIFSDVKLPVIFPEILKQLSNATL